MTDSHIRTFTGKLVDPLDLKPEDIDIRDIAHALSQQCRFTGHTRKFYSVAEHCILVSELCPTELKLAGLLHDADEAYLIDLARPVKHSKGFEFFREFGKKIQKTIFETLHIPPAFGDAIKEWDMEAFELERASFMHGGSKNPDWEPLAPIEAERNYLARYEQLRGLCEPPSALHQTPERCRVHPDHGTHELQSWKRDEIYLAPRG